MKFGESISRNFQILLQYLPDVIGFQTIGQGPVTACMRFLLLLLAPSLVGAEMDPDYFGGPTELQDVFLPSQVRYQSYPESARIVPQGKWRVTMEADWTAHLAQTETYLFDGESVTSTLKLRHSPWEDWELGIDLPYTFRVDGTADEFIEFVETALDAQVPARFTLPRDTYQATLITRDQKVMILEKGNGLNDITLRAKRQLTRTEQHGFDSALAGTLSLPSGEDTFGGEGVAPSLGLHLQKPYPYINFYLGAVGVFYSDHNEQGLQLEQWRGMAYGGTAIKPFSWGELIVLYQLYSPLARHNAPLDDPAHYYSVTGRFWMGKKVTFEAGVVENLGIIENRNSSDVTFKFALAMNF